MVDMHPIASHFEAKLKESAPEFAMFEMMIRESNTTLPGKQNLNNIMF